MTLQTKQPLNHIIGHVNNIPTMQFFTEISRNTQSKSYNMLSFTECVWDFQNNALWDTKKHALLLWQTLGTVLYPRIIRAYYFNLVHKYYYCPVF